VAYAWTITKFIKNVTAVDISFSLNLWIMLGTGVMITIEGKTASLTLYV
jgi:hypothetical protein